MNHSPKNLALTAACLATVAFITGCGGGGSTASGPVAVTGAVMDGYITGAIVCLDLNSNRMCDSGEPTATTGANGRYSLTAPSGTNLANLHIIATVPAGAIDSDAPTTPITNPYTMLAPATMPTVVSPLTTAISTKMIAEGKTISEARIAARADLALPVSYDFATNHVAATDKGPHNVARVMAAMLATNVGSETPSATNLSQALANMTTGGTAASAYASTNINATVNALLPTVVLNFDTVTIEAAKVVGGEGATATITSNRPAGGGTGSVLKVVRSGGQTYALGILEVPAIPFTSTRKTLSARVYSPTAGIPMKLKLEAGASFVEVAANEAVVAGWQTLSWTFSDLDPALSWNKIVLLPNIGTIDTPPGKEYVYDDFVLKAGPPPTPTTPSGTTVLLDFDATSLETNKIASDHGGFASITSTPPSGGTGSALKLLRSGGQTYALAVLNVPAIPFTSTRKTISARVYSPIAGIPIKIKLETTVNPTNTGDIAANEAVVVGWQTLTWTFTNLNPALSWTTIVLLPNLDTVDAPPGKEYFFDNFVLNAAAPAPTTSAVVSTGFNDNTTTKNGGSWYHYFGPDSAAGGGDGGQGGAGYRFVYINNSRLAGTFQGIGVVAPTSSVVSTAGKTTLNYTLAVNDEWFSGVDGAKYALLIKSYVPGVSTSTCHPEVATVEVATASGDTAYATPLSRFTRIEQNCGNAGVTPAQVLAGEVKEVHFKANGGESAWTINGITSNTNKTVPKVTTETTLYPTAITVIGGVQFQ